MNATVQIVGLAGFPEIAPGADLVALTLAALERRRLALLPGDVVVYTSKIVSKAEGRAVALADVVPSPLAISWAAAHAKDARQVEVVLREARRIVRMDRGVLIAETRHGFICANAGVDASNVAGAEAVCLLPLDPDASAARLRAALRERTGVDAPVIISDSFGRTWRAGIVNVAIGISGLAPLADYRGQDDPYGRTMHASILAVADELAAAAELVMGKTEGIPAAIIRNYPYKQGPGSALDLLMGPERDLFR
jgi:coenzyme F420-0:L-glutamate ligase/coenzyme F420-1:gamma-L-glutamate ligase